MDLYIGDSNETNNVAYMLTFDLDSKDKKEGFTKPMI
jgi:hypothetical protein